MSLNCTLGIDWRTRKKKNSHLTKISTKLTCTYLMGESNTIVVHIQCIGTYNSFAPTHQLYIAFITTAKKTS